MVSPSPSVTTHTSLSPSLPTALHRRASLRHSAAVHASPPSRPLLEQLEIKLRLDYCFCTGGNFNGLDAPCARTSFGFVSLMENVEFYQTDCESLWCQIKHQEKQIQLKRRWLLGTPLSESEQKQFEDFGRDLLPESLLREDDMFYENVKSAVQAAYGACNVEGENQVFGDSIVMPGRKSVSRALLSCLDDLTTKGLHVVATTLTRGSVKFEETRWEMKKIIKESLGKKFDDEAGVFKRLLQHLSDPQHFRDKFVTVMSSTSQAHVRKVLDGLQDLPDEALIAMHRKLIGGEQHVPRLKSERCKISNLIAKLRKTCEKMLSELGPGDELQVSLAKAMTVAGLSVKLRPGSRNSTATEFHQVSQEIKILQDDIASAIWLVSFKSKVSVPELEYLKTLLDRDAKVSKRSLRYAIRKMLTEYLFECSDMDTIPESLSKAVDIINKKSGKKLHRPNLNDEIDAEVECILNVSAQTKQIVWNMFPDHELDLDFTDAYVEEMEDEDDDEDGSDDDDDENHIQGSPQEQRTFESDNSHSDGSLYDDESIGESTPCTSNLSTTSKSGRNPPGGNSVFVEEVETLFSNQGISGGSNDIKRGFNGTSTERHEQEDNSGMDTQDPFHVEPDVVHKQTTCNQYLAIQKVCDETSMVAYDLVGHMLEEFAQTEGLDIDCDDTLYFKGDCATEEDSEGLGGEQTSSQESGGGSVIVNVIKDLIPSFPKSGIEAVRNLVG
ncbi:uncharacterized protein LOC126803344 [Argentina anserina]|uniref:uncharacterized protein LOC126803344 n=1 Tax=Argentina anserina TaxID=57926 RepID=UPI00217691A2|nr:uncharacterized protein LOC126803344 [Potentilla anserina]